MLTYVRSKLSEPNPSRRFAPLIADHPAIGERCLLCSIRFHTGDSTTLVALGPGEDPEERERCAAGGAYNAIAVLLHWSCATGRDDAWLGDTPGMPIQPQPVAPPKEEDPR